MKRALTVAVATTSMLMLAIGGGAVRAQDQTEAPSAAGCTTTFSKPGFPDNVRVNSDCSGIDQLEEWVSVNPTDPSNVIIGHNDGARVGVEYSLQGGAPGSFGETELALGGVPCDPSNAMCGPVGLWSYDLFTDPSHAHDARGNLYFLALGYDLAQDSVNGLYVWKSNACGKGRVLGSPSDHECIPTSNYLIPAVVHDNFDNPNNQENKPWLAAGPRPDRPNRTQVGVVWPIDRYECGDGGTDFCDSRVYFSRSIDGGVRWSKAKDISGHAAFCVGGDAATGDPSDADACNQNPAINEVIAPDGTIYVAWLNFNTPSLVNQMLFRRSTDGGKTWSKVIRIGDYSTTEPVSLPGHQIPDCPLFRECLPPNGYRLGVGPTLSINSATGGLVATWADFRDGGPCTFSPVFGVMRVPCENSNEDVFLATSADRGSHWSAAKLVTGNGGVTAQWLPAGASGDEPGELFVSYYDRRYGDCETTGCNDVTLATSHDDGDSWSYRRITTSSMPNLTCADLPNECGFLGDYQGIAYFDDNVYLDWADTRGRGFNAPEQDVYFATLPVG